MEQLISQLSLSGSVVQGESWGLLGVFFQSWFYMNYINWLIQNELTDIVHISIKNYFAHYLQNLLVTLTAPLRDSPSSSSSPSPS